MMLSRRSMDRDSAGPWGPATLAAAFALALFITAFAVPNPARAMNIQTIKSPGGIEAWLVEEHSVPLMALRFSFEGGNTQDPENKDGVANFLTAMMDEGAGDLDANSFQERAEEIAMRMGFEDSKDAFYGSFETLTVNRPKALELLRLAVTKPRFDTDAVDRIRQQLLASLVYADRDPEKVAMREWYALAFAGHPYGRPANGTKQSLSSIKRTDLVDYHARVFARNNLKVVAVGDITPAEFGKLLDDVFGDLPAEARLTAVSQTALSPTGKQSLTEMNVPQSVAVFGMAAMARKDPDFITAFVLNHILGGGGFSAKLMEEVREKRGLAYSVYSYLQPFQHASIIAGSVATKNESIGESLAVIKSVMAEMAKDGPTADDLDAAKKYLTGSYALRFDTNTKIASQLLGLLQDDFGPDYVENRNKLIEAVTLDDVRRVARRLLDTNGLIVNVVGKPTGLTPAAAVAPATPPG